MFLNKDYYLFDMILLLLSKQNIGIYWIFTTPRTIINHIYTTFHIYYLEIDNGITIPFIIYCNGKA